MPFNEMCSQLLREALLLPNYMEISMTQPLFLASRTFLRRTRKFAGVLSMRQRLGLDVRNKFAWEGQAQIGSPLHRACQMNLSTLESGPSFQATTSVNVRIVARDTLCKRARHMSYCQDKW